MSDNCTRPMFTIIIDPDTDEEMGIEMEGIISEQGGSEFFVSLEQHAWPGIRLGKFPDRGYDDSGQPRQPWIRRVVF